MSTEPQYRSGFVALVGRTNAGKSTLVNAITGEKISIISAKAQTTRNKIRAIVNRDDAQIVFIDTPGVHLWLKRKLNQVMVDTAISTLGDADCVLMLVDATQALTRAGGIPDIEENLIQAIEKSGRKCILAINKIDTLPSPSEVLPMIDAYSKRFDYLSVIAVSARKRRELARLVDLVTKELPIGPALYPQDLYTDQSERFLAAEAIREVIYYQMGEELPYAAVVEIDDFKSLRSENKIEIMATVYVERESQKAIFIGKRGAAIKKLGTEARMKLQDLLQAKVHLSLHVKVRTDWSENIKDLKQFGYTEE